MSEPSTLFYCHHCDAFHTGSEPCIGWTVPKPTPPEGARLSEEARCWLERFADKGWLQAKELLNFVEHYQPSK